MINELITPATVLAVSVADAKLNLRIDGDDLNLLVEAWLRGVIAHAEDYMQRAIMTQTRRISLDCFPGAIPLAFPPIASVSSVKYYDSNSQLHTLASADYQANTRGLRGSIVPAPGKCWPSTANRINAVEVEYLVGYGDNPAAVPPQIRLYVLAKLVEQFDPSVKQENISIRKSFTDSLLDTLRVRRVF